MPSVLFLDFDGVLHPKGAGGAAQHFCHRPLLETLLLESAFTQIRIVVASTWREAYSLQRLREFFCPELRPRIIDRTPVLDDLDSDHLRYREIRAWLNRHPEVKQWYALDDDTDGFPDIHRSRVVLTDPATGLTAREVALLRGLFTKAG